METQVTRAIDAVDEMLQNQLAAEVAASGSVPDLDVAVERVALYRRLADRADQVDELLRRRAVRRPRGRDDVLLDHHRAQVVGAEAEGDLADLQPLRHPRGLD